VDVRVVSFAKRKLFKDEEKVVRGRGNSFDGVGV